MRRRHEQCRTAGMSSVAPQARAVSQRRHTQPQDSPHNLRNGLALRAHGRVHARAESMPEAEAAEEGTSAGRACAKVAGHAAKGAKVAGHVPKCSGSAGSPCPTIDQPQGARATCTSRPPTATKCAGDSASHIHTTQCACALSPRTARPCVGAHACVRVCSVLFFVFFFECVCVCCVVSLSS